MSGSHRLGSLYTPSDFGEQPTLDTLLCPNDNELLWSLAALGGVVVDGAPVHRAPFAAGAAIIFYGSCLHGAPGNATERNRRGYTRSIIAADVRYTGMPFTSRPTPSA